MTKNLKVLASVVLAFVFAYWLAPAGLRPSQRIVQGILVLAVSLWLTGAVPAFAVGILIVFLSVATLGFVGGGVVFQLAILYQTWSSPIIFLLLGGAILAEAVKIVGIDKQIAGYAFRIFGSRPQSLLLGLMTTSGLISMILSNTATAALMTASAASLIERLGSKHNFAKATLLGIATAASIGGIGTAIGSPPNAIAIGELATENISVNFVQWSKYGFPLAFALILIAWFIILRSFPLPSGVTLDNPDAELKTMTVGWKRKLTVVTAVLTIGLWLTTPLHRFHMSAIASIPTVVLTLTGVVGSEELKRIPWDSLMLVTGGLTLGEALDRTGLAEYYVHRLDLTAVSPLVVMLIFGYLTVVMSNVMSNTATASLLIPIGIQIVPTYALQVAVTTALCASFAMLLPVSTGPNAIAFATGHLRQSDFRRTGLVMGLLGPLLAVLYLHLINT